MFKKKKKEKPGNKIILGMIMLKDKHPFNLKAFIKDYNSNYAEKVRDLNGDNSTATFTINGETILVGHMPVPIPVKDIKETAEYAYNWLSAFDDSKDHESHLIISIVGSEKGQIDRYKLFTQVICSLLRTTSSIGVYMGNQSLLIPCEDYLNEAGLMGEEYFPLNLWVYFGLKINRGKNFGYTYGLKEFNKKEMEILDSAKDLEEIRAFLFNMAHYVLEYNVEFKEGQTCGLSEDQKIKISFSKGHLAEGETFKLAY
jgi:hypothetical protein